MTLYREYLQLPQSCKTAAIYLLSVTQDTAELAEIKRPGKLDNWQP